MTNWDSLLTVCICVAVFWTLITFTAVLCRRILFLLFGLNADVRAGRHSQPASGRLVSPVDSNEALFLALLDTIATFEVCACSLECWPVRAAADRTALLVAIALNAVRSTVFTFRDAYGNPCTPWYRLLTGKSTVFWVGTTWMLQLVAAHIAFCCAKMWWSLAPTIHHAARYQLVLNPEQVVPDLQTSALVGMLTEAVGTFFDVYLAFLFMYWTVSWNRRCLRNAALARRLDTAPGDVSDRNSDIVGEACPTRLQFVASFCLRLLINLYLTAQFLSVTGMYINPANAFAHCWGIGGIAPFTHIAVYWLGPFLGVWLALRAESVTLRAFQQVRPIQVTVPRTNSTREKKSRKSPSPHRSLSDTMISSIRRECISCATVNNAAGNTVRRLVAEKS